MEPGPGKGIVKYVDWCRSGCLGGPGDLGIRIVGVGLRAGLRVGESHRPSWSAPCELGVTLLDTAEIYGFGRSERMVGHAIAGHREEAFVASKLFPVAPVGPIVERRLRGSLRRLGIDVVDLYQLHRPNPVVPIRATTAAMASPQREGLVRHVGVSNYSLVRWQAAERGLLGPVVTNQVRYYLVDRRVEARSAPLGSGTRPHRHRLQPARSGRVVWALRRGAPATWLDGR